MDCIKVLGGHPLHGEIAIQGSKNAILPMIAGAVLHDGISILHNCPMILDVVYMTEILRELGCKVIRQEDTLIIDAAGIKHWEVSAVYATRLRSSIVLMGSLLGRLHRADMSYPGGCTIGARPIDLHLKAFQQMGVSIEEQKEGLCATTEGMKGTEIDLPFPSVGATENVILGAVLSNGTTTIKGAAREPEILELCAFLNQKGADISGMGTDCVKINGVRRLRDSEYNLGADRIVAGTYILAAVGTRGSITIPNAPIGQMESLLSVLEEMGATIERNGTVLHVDGSYAEAPVAYIETKPYPGFPTDLQSQLMAVLCRAKGKSCIWESMFEARFQVAEQLGFMGAHIVTKEQEACMNGVAQLQGCKVSALELRGGAALVIAGLMAEGTTIIENRHFIDRGYADICRDLRTLGATVCLGEESLIK